MDNVIKPPNAAPAFMRTSCCLVTIIAMINSIGCTKSADLTTANDPEAEVSPVTETADQTLVANEPAEPIPADLPAQTSDLRVNDLDQPFEPFERETLLADPNALTDDGLAESPDIAVAADRPMEPDEAPRLRKDMMPEALIKFLASADADMQLIHSNRAGIEDPREARETLVKIVNLKLQASRQLATHEKATPAQRSEGRRGELQSLSHLAALSDVKAAEELQKLAEANLSSDDTALAADSRLVMIGFAIEALQNGDEDAAERIIELANQIASSDSAADVPALIVLGQAKQTLERYGHADRAKSIRDKIIQNFADSKNPDVANMAAQFAGNVVFDQIDRLRGQILDGEPVTVQDWLTSVETLIDESADMQTVGYLAGAAVDFEASKMSDYADATLKTMQRRFTDPDAATTREVQTAIAATRARKEILGQSFDPDLPSLSGSRLNLKEYRGRVVLVPFWGMGIPLSVQPLAMLKSIRDSHPNNISIVGVNLDPQDADVQTFVNENGIDFPNFQMSADSESAIPRKFGMVSMPFVVILDADGKVAAIQLSDEGLRENVQRLLADLP